MPVEVEDDMLVTLLLVVLRPVESEMAVVEVDVDKLLIAWSAAYSCEPLIASVLVALIWPAATLVSWRSELGAPTLTTLVGFAPAKLYVVPPIVALDVGFGAAVTEPAPSATALAFAAVAPNPSAIAPLAAAFAPLPTATPLAPAAVALVPAASAFTPVAPSLL